MSDFEEYGYDDEYNDDEFDQVISFNQLEQVSFSHELLNGYSPLSQFAESIRESLSDIINDTSNEFTLILQRILNFLRDNSDKIQHIYYKNPEMFVLGFLCTNFRTGEIDMNIFKKYVKEKHNINDMIRYCVLIQKMLK